MTEGDLVTLSRGEVVRAGASPSSEWRVHVAIYAARPDVGAIVHTHSVHATAWSCLAEPLDTRIKEYTHALGGAGAHRAPTLRPAPRSWPPTRSPQSGTATARCCTATECSRSATRRRGRSWSRR